MLAQASDRIEKKSTSEPLDGLTKPVVGLSTKNRQILERSGFTEFFVWLGRENNIVGVCAKSPFFALRHGAFTPHLQVSMDAEGVCYICIFGRGAGGMGHQVGDEQLIIPPRVMKALRSWAAEACTSENK
jgi:hypothetical protein